MSERKDGTNQKGGFNQDDIHQDDIHQDDVHKGQSVGTQDDALAQDYVDQALAGDALARFEERMQSDLVLRRRVTEIRSLQQDLEALPTEASVPDRVWDGILTRIQEGEAESAEPATSGTSATSDSGPKITLLSSAASTREETRGPQLPRRFSFSVPQLAAAAIVLVSLGSALTWTMASAPQGLPVATAPGAVTQASTTSGDDPLEALFVEYETSSAALMEIVNDGASVLSEETIQIVRESVAAIDQAVSEAREALKQDPGSVMLNRILLSNMQKKLDLLRSTAAAVQSRV